MEKEQDIPTVKCSDCGAEKLQTDFYRSGAYYYKRCKYCHNQTRKRYKQKERVGSSYDRLAQDTVKAIMADVDKNRAGHADKLSKAEIARKHGVEYQKLIYWIRSGKV